MAVYTVHEPPIRPGDSRPDPVRFAFVRDGFHFWAFVAPPLWMLWHRLWLVFFGYLVLGAALAALFWATGTGSGARMTIMLLIGLLVGLEAPTLRRWTLTRRRWREVGIVVADNAQAAERRFFDGWDVPGPAPAQPLRPAMSFKTPPANPVLGLFPDPGRRP